MAQPQGRDSLKRMAVACMQDKLGCKGLGHIQDPKELAIACETAIGSLLHELRDSDLNLAGLQIMLWDREPPKDTRSQLAKAAEYYVPVVQDIFCCEAEMSELLSTDQVTGVAKQLALPPNEPEGGPLLTPPQEQLRSLLSLASLDLHCTLNELSPRIQTFVHDKMAPANKATAEAAKDAPAKKPLDPQRDLSKRKDKEQCMLLFDRDVVQELTFAAVWLRGGVSGMRDPSKWGRVTSNPKNEPVRLENSNNYTLELLEALLHATCRSDSCYVPVGLLDFLAASITWDLHYGLSWFYRQPLGIPLADVVANVRASFARMKDVASSTGQAQLGQTFAAVLRECDEVMKCKAVADEHCLGFRCEKCTHMVK